MTRLNCLYLTDFFPQNLAHLPPPMLAHFLYVLYFFNMIQIFLWHKNVFNVRHSCRSTRSQEQLCPATPVTGKVGDIHPVLRQAATAPKSSCRLQYHTAYPPKDVGSQFSDAYKAWLGTCSFQGRILYCIDWGFPHYGQGRRSSLDHQGWRWGRGQPGWPSIHGVNSDPQINTSSPAAYEVQKGWIHY